MKKWLLLFTLALLSGVFVIGWSVYDEMSKAASDDPLVWESVIADFEAEDLESPPPPEATLFVGSSSIRLWHTLAADMAPLVTIRRGFGGSRMDDVVHYAQRLILAYNPAQVVIFVGANDINVSDNPMQAVEVIASGLQSLIDTIHKARADTEIFYIAITPSIIAWDKYAAVEATNKRAASICDAHDRVHFIATDDLFLKPDGLPEEKLYQFDGLHLSSDGYERWTARIKPLLQRR